MKTSALQKSYFRRFDRPAFASPAPLGMLMVFSSEGRLKHPFSSSGF
jgi:hypothetical protein